jgi:hypothetical protein
MGMGLDRLRYKGKPAVGVNVQADKVQELCFCKFIAVGVAMDARKCSVHEFGQRLYSCSRTGCIDYRPSKMKTSPAH